MEAPTQASPSAPYLYPQFQHQNKQQEQLQAPSADGMFYGYQKPLSLSGPAAPYQASLTQEQVKTVKPETANVVVLNNASTPLGPDPQTMTCPQCNVKMLTRLDYRATYRTHVFAFLLCITGLCCFAPLPYCMKSCRQRYHFCGNCGSFLGKSLK